MKNKLALLLLILILAIFSVACQTEEAPAPAPTPPPQEEPKEEGKYKDGDYNAELDPDERGWKAVVDLTVEGGKITEVNFDEINAENVKKSENEDYLKRWGEAAKIDASKVYGQYEEDLIETQDVEEVEVITGATSSHEKFQNVVKKALGE